MKIWRRPDSGMMRAGILDMERVNTEGRDRLFGIGSRRGTVARCGVSTAAQVARLDSKKR